MYVVLFAKMSITKAKFCYSYIAIMCARFTQRKYVSYFIATYKMYSYTATVLMFNAMITSIMKVLTRNIKYIVAITGICV